jgi:hypothetical protein
VERTLREGGERPELLDLLAEELHAERLPTRAREDVHEAAANGDLPAFLDPLRALVACEGEGLYERVEADLVPDREPDRGGPDACRRKAFGECPSGGADEASAIEHGQRPGSLSDEVRRRFEPRIDAYAPAREQRHPGGIRVPRDRVGGVPRLLVLRQQADEGASERLVERREDERKGGLGDARVGRERAREHGEALAAGELLHESVKG